MTNAMEMEQISSSTTTTIPQLVRVWWRECVWPGLGLFGESYLLFSIGTLFPLWELLFDDCFVSFQTCNGASLKHALTYTVVVGVICGMMLLGTLANTLGRRVGSILTASLMCSGAWGMTLCSMVFTKNALILFRCMVVLLFVFGVGVGGEYPLSASSASERAMAELQQQQQVWKNTTVEFDYAQVNEENSSSCNMKEQQQQQQQQHYHRGRRVQLVFAMQGMGIMCNCILMTLLLLLLGQTGKNDGDLQNDIVSGSYTASALLSIWRITYAIGAAVLSYVLVSRILFLQESQVWLVDQQKRQDDDKKNKRDVSSVSYIAPELSQENINESVMSDVSSLSAPSVQVVEERSIRDVPSTTSTQDLHSSELSLLLRNYGCRLFGASMSWFLWDIAFYGNKLFQASFLLALTGEETTLLEMSAAATLNALVALAGYYCAAAIMDIVGRVQLQQYGFVLTGILFCCCGFFYDTLPTNWLVAIYFASSFCGQCGPNATSFVIPAEIFPTEMRTMCHGIAAASGKAGALLAAILFSRVQTTTNLFLWSGYASFTAAVITFVCIPETTDLNLYETDRRWHMILQGKKADYVGEATMPKYLSFFERQKMEQRHRTDGSCDHDVHDI